MNEPLVPSGSEYEPSSSFSEASEERSHLEGDILTSLCERGKPLPLTKHLSPTCGDDSFQESSTNISDMGKKDETTHNKVDTEENQQWVEQAANLHNNFEQNGGNGYSRQLIALKDIISSVHMLFDAMKPGMFLGIITATKVISGYDSMKKSYKSPSLALHMGTNLKLLCDIALKIVIEKRVLPKIKWEDRNLKKEEIKDLTKLVQ
ncbi:hypothetical protein HHI36_013161 [Cryptolaemus montrouzieri]|uniref:Uncharacterized protein n=1 Tax=Cryptolaemus montrouzieri TaxID=559131 RepID=A0ABD2NGZ6_9CUCU